MQYNYKPLNIIYYLRICDILKNDNEEYYNSLDHIYYSKNIYNLKEFNKALQLSNKLDKAKNNEIYTEIFNSKNNKKMGCYFNSNNRLDNIYLSLDDYFKNVYINIEKNIKIGITHYITINIIRDDYIIYSENFYNINLAKSFVLGMQFANIPKIIIQYNINLINSEKI